MPENLRLEWVLPDFSSGTTLVRRQSLGIFLLSVTLLKKRSSHFRAFCPICLMSSVWMSSRPGVLPFFSAVIPSSSSSTVKALVNPRLSGYLCLSRCTFSCFFCTHPLSSSCMMCDFVCSGIVLLLWHAWIVAHFAYCWPRLLAVVCHVCRFDQSLPWHTTYFWDGVCQLLSQRDGILCEWVRFIFLLCWLGCQSWDVVPPTSTRDVLSCDFS